MPARSGGRLGFLAGNLLPVEGDGDARQALAAGGPAGEDKARHREATLVPGLNEEDLEGRWRGAVDGNNVEIDP